jgi:antirestriction protein ArdC
VPTVRHADYLGCWIETLREDNCAIIRAASAASKAADYLLAFRDGDSAAPPCEADWPGLPSPEPALCSIPALS